MLYIRNNLNLLSHNYWRKSIAWDTTTTKQTTWAFGKLAKSILGSFSSNVSKSSHFTSTFNEWWVIIIYQVYVSQNNAKIVKSLDYAPFNAVYKLSYNIQTIGCVFYVYIIIRLIFLLIQNEEMAFTACKRNNANAIGHHFTSTVLHLLATRSEI